MPRRPTIVSPALVKNPGAILRDAIRLLNNPNPAVHDQIFKRFGVADENYRESLLRMFEMVRAGQAALTSCAWFFDDYGGLEGRVALRWAAQAVELAAEYSASVENELARAVARDQFESARKWRRRDSVPKSENARSSRSRINVFRTGAGRWLRPKRRISIRR